MANRFFKGDEPKVAKLYTFTISGTLTPSATYTLALLDASGGSTVRSVVYTSDGTPTLTEIVQGLVDAWNAAAYHEMAEATAATDDASTGIFTLTQADAVAGAAFFVSLATSGAATLNTTTTTASSGPGDWSLAKNWTADTTPGSSDAVYVDNLPDDIEDNLEAFSQVGALVITDCQQIGRELYVSGESGYLQYRPRYLKAITSSVYIKSPETTRLRFDGADPGSVIEMIIDDLGRDGNENELEAMLFKCGASFGYNVTLNRGSLGIAVLPGETAKVTNLRQGYLDNENDTRVRCGAGVTLGNVYRTGGAFDFQTALTLLEQREKAGVATFRGGAVTLATVTLYAGELVMLPTVTTSVITNLILGPGTTLDLTKCQFPVQCPNTITMYAGASLLDPFDRLNIAVGSNTDIAITTAGCTLADLTIVRKTGKTYSKL